MEKIVDWCSNRWFSLIHQNTLVYNACWEDPRIDRVALELTPDDTMLTITSAGCNTLDYALLGPKKIHAVDMNPKQNALLELKVAGIRELEYEDFFELFGKGRHPNFSSLYYRKLRRHLSPSSITFWDNRLHYFAVKGDFSGLYFRGGSGLVARYLNHYIDLHKLREPMQAIFDAESLKEQDYIYRNVLHKAFWTKFLDWILQWDVTYSFAGIPREQRRQVEQTYQGGMRQFIEDCLEAVFSRIPLSDNYFWWLYVNGEYVPERCPEYLKEKNFKALKSGLVDKISIHTSTIVNFLKDTSEQISRFVLLDHMDWLRGSLKPVLHAEWELILAKAAPETRILWRSASLEHKFVDDIQVPYEGANQRVGDLLQYQDALAKKLAKKDRVHTYGSFAIADVRL